MTLLTRSSLFVLSLLLLCLTQGVLLAQTRSKGIWARAGVGYGSVSRWTTGRSARAQGSVALRGEVGYNFDPTLGFGVEVFSWEMEELDKFDPSKGEGIGGLLAIAEVYPWSRRGAFLKGGAGLATYHNNHTGSVLGDGPGLGFTVGAGYDLHLLKAISATLSTQWSFGSYTYNLNLLQPSTDRHFHVLDLILGLAFR